MQHIINVGHPRSRHLLDLNVPNEASFQHAVGAFILNETRLRPIRNWVSQCTIHHLDVHQWTLLNGVRLSFAVNLMTLSGDNEPIVVEMDSANPGHGYRAMCVNILRVAVRDDEYRYLLIRDPLLFLKRGPGQRRHVGTKFCNRCLRTFYAERRYNKHVAEFQCFPEPVPVETMPKSDEDGNPPRITFKNYAALTAYPVQIYFDFETMNRPLRPDCNICQNRCRCAQSYIRDVSRHEAISVVFIVVNSEGLVLHEESIFGIDAGKTFVERLLDLENDLLRIIKTPVPLTMTIQDEAAFRASSHCHVCRKPISPGEVAVRDHNHVNGKYEGKVSPY